MRAVPPARRIGRYGQHPLTGRSQISLRRLGRCACKRERTPAALTFRSRPPGPRLTVTRGSRSANHKPGGQQISTQVTTAGPIYRCQHLPRWL